MEKVSFDGMNHIFMDKLVGAAGGQKSTHPFAVLFIVLLKFSIYLFTYDLFYCYLYEAIIVLY